MTDWGIPQTHRKYWSVWSLTFLGNVSLWQAISCLPSLILTLVWRRGWVSLCVCGLEVREGVTDKAGHRCGCAGWRAWHDAGCSSADAAYRRDRREVWNLIPNWSSSHKDPPLRLKLQLSSSLVSPVAVWGTQIYQVARLRSAHRDAVVGASCVILAVMIWCL